MFSLFFCPHSYFNVQEDILLSNGYSYPTKRFTVKSLGIRQTKFLKNIKFVHVRVERLQNCEMFGQVTLTSFERSSYASLGRSIAEFCEQARNKNKRFFRNVNKQKKQLGRYWKLSPFHYLYIFQFRYFLGPSQTRILAILPAFSAVCKVRNKVDANIWGTEFQFLKLFWLHVSLFWFANNNSLKWKTKQKKGPIVFQVCYSDWP